jgi:hypothetical protein
MIHLRTWWPRVLSLDIGFAHASAVIWHATDGENVYVYREFVRQHLTAPELAAEIVKLTPDQERKAIKAFYVGPDAFSRKTSDRTQAIELDTALASHGFPSLSPAAAGPGDRRLGWLFLYQMFKEGKLKISPACPVLVKAIPAAVRDYPDHAEDLLKTETDGDDALDALRYGVYTSSLSPRLPIELEAAKLVTVPMSNLTGRALQYREAMQDVRRRRAGMSLGR